MLKIEFNFNFVYIVSVTFKVVSLSLTPEQAVAKKKVSFIRTKP